MNHTQLADVMRPKCLDEIVGQTHLFGERGVIRRMLRQGRLPNMIFYGPPGTGKTTAAAIIAKESGMTFHRLNATTASLADVKEVLKETENVFGAEGVLLYLDEIQYFNRKQQQTLLEYIEDGRVTLIASTTENPHFYVYNAIISRSSLFEFRPVPPEETVKALRRALSYLNESFSKENGEKTASDETLLMIAKACGGDVRRSIGALENAYFASDAEIDTETVAVFDFGVGNFSDDTHFDLLSCLQKSIRGSDPDAAVFYLARLLDKGELLAAVRRLRVIASEDVGLAYPLAVSVTHACCEDAIALGLPEGRIPLANAAILLATSPKSNAAEAAIDAATEAIRAGKGGDVPVHLQSPLFRGYKYQHDYKNHYVRQQYLPDDLCDAVFYHPGDNKTEQAAKAYAEKIRSEAK
ncbi:MAG: replication-associated recombination protein A [Clostridia bacterium]|nr:replication-associated recombination protein A [Clostridia bacterium]